MWGVYFTLSFFWKFLGKLLLALPAWKKVPESHSNLFQYKMFIHISKSFLWNTGV